MSKPCRAYICARRKYSFRQIRALPPSGHARGGTQITLICIAIGSGSPTAKTIHNGGSCMPSSASAWGEWDRAAMGPRAARGGKDRVGSTVNARRSVPGLVLRRRVRGHVLSGGRPVRSFPRPSAPPTSGGLRSSSSRRCMTSGVAVMTGLACLQRGFSVSMAGYYGGMSCLDRELPREEGCGSARLHLRASIRLPRARST